MQPKISSQNTQKNPNLHEDGGLVGHQFPTLPPPKKTVRSCVAKCARCYKYKFGCVQYKTWLLHLAGSSDCKRH